MKMIIAMFACTYEKLVDLPPQVVMQPRAGLADDMTEGVIYANKPAEYSVEMNTPNAKGRITVKWEPSNAS